MADQMDLSFIKVLSKKAEAAQRKTERTRFRLQASLAGHIMDGTNRSDLKVAEVTEKAGLAHGTFYRYFDDIRVATDTLVADFAEFVRDTLSTPRQGEAGSRERTQAVTAIYAEVFAANALLMKCLFDAGREAGTSSDTYQWLNRSWYERIAASIARQRHSTDGPDAETDETCLATAFALGGMVDEFLAQVHLRREPALSAFRENPAHVAAFLTDLWIKGAYGTAPAQLVLAEDDTCQPTGKDGQAHSQ